MLKRVWKPSLRRTWKLHVHSRGNRVLIPAEEKIEEETLLGYAAKVYYPVRIGQTFQSRYQVVGKLGFGGSSTVWLARDLHECQYVALKVCVKSAELRGSELDRELDAYKRIAESPDHHPGRGAIRSLLNSFDVEGPSGRHLCLVHPPLWESIRKIRHRSPVGRLPAPVLALVLQRLFLALDLLHTECHVAHTDIREENILLEADSSVLTRFESDELKEPSPKKELHGTIVYPSREMGTPKEFGLSMLCDFGLAVPLDDGHEHREVVQPCDYHAPEIILDIPWTYSVDIWNVGCMVWDAFEGEPLFTGRDPEFGTYTGRAHLAEMTALLGPPPPSLLARANLRSEFFSDEGDFIADIPKLSPRPLEQRERFLDGEECREERECFLRFMRKMLQWEPEQRSSARELVEDEWILKYTEGE
uniref:non-specific serine/threonine protein kinase n=1 Tax=Ramularia collo-cygni TaxID=112498 RepID=A0A2D3V6D5_9PEZI